MDDGTATTVQRWGTHGPVMLCVHGMTSSRRSWERLARHFTGRFRVFAYDQRGHGDSAAVAGPMALSRAQRDLENVAAAFDEPVHVLVGHSWGGAVAILGAPRIGAHAVVAIDPMLHQVADDWYDEYIAELEEAFAFHGEERDARTRREFADWDTLDIEGKVHAVHAMTTEPIARLQRENPRESWDLRRYLEEYDRPLLLAMAGSDGSIVDEAVMTVVEREKSSNVTIAVFSTEGHNLHRTALPALLMRMEDFIARSS